MLTKNEVKQLETDGRLRAPVLSLYLNLDRKTAEGQHYLAELRRILNIAFKQLSARYKNSAPFQDQLHRLVVPQLLKFIDDEISRFGVIRSLALFASLAEKTTRHNNDIIIYTLPRPVRSQTHIENTAYVRPLLFLMDQYEQYAVIIANQNRANFYLVGMGEIEQTAEFVSDVLNRSHRGGWSQKRHEHKVDRAIEKHVRQICHYAVKQLAHTEISRIILGGDSDMLYLLKRNLPEREQKMVVGAISSKPHESSHETLERTLVVAETAERQSEKAIVLELQNLLAYPNKATAGIASTLKAINEKRVGKLLLMQGFHAPGTWCPNCDYLSLPGRVCGNCQTLTKPLEDVLEAAAEKILIENGTVEFVEQNIDLAAIGHVGAVLRF